MTFSDAVTAASTAVGANLLIVVGVLGAIIAIGVGVRFLVSWIRKTAK